MDDHTCPIETDRVPLGRWRGRTRAWLARYAPAEVAGLTFAVIGSHLGYALQGGEVAAAYGATIGEVLGFYGLILVRDIRVHARREAAPGGAPSGVWRATRDVMRHATLEFGPAELIDSAAVRPLLIALATRVLGRTRGVMAGKLLADLVFYGVVIGGGEVRRRWGRRRARSPHQARVPAPGQCGPASSGRTAGR